MGPRRQGDGNDRACLRRLARGDRDALDEIYRRHAATAWRHALWITGRVEDADDVVQAVFVRLVAGGVDLLGIRRLRSYLAATVHHEAIAVARRRAGRRQDPDIDPDALLAPGAGPEMEAERLLLARHLAALPSDQREVVVLRSYGGFSFRQIGRALGVSRFTAASRWRLALARLRRAFEVKG